jgi:predicted metal-dependent hydrolase
VPGQGPRHDPERFAALHAGVTGGMGPDDLVRTDAWAAGLLYLDKGFFWEAHEVLEPVWMATEPGSAEREIVQALIQIANAALKVRMNRPRAVLRLCDIADAHVSAAGRDAMGLARASLRARIAGIRQGRFG